MEPSLEENAKLLPILEKASDILAESIFDDSPKLAGEFNSIIQQISETSQLLAELYERLYYHIPSIKKRIYYNSIKNI